MGWIDCVPCLEHLQKLGEESIDRRRDDLMGVGIEVRIKTDNYPDQGSLRRLGILDRYELLALYQELPAVSQSSLKLPEFLFLYRGPLSKYALDTGKEIKDLIIEVIDFELERRLNRQRYRTPEIWWAPEDSNL